MTSSSPPNSNKKRRLIHETEPDNNNTPQSNVRVVARLRPLSQKEIKEKCKEAIHGGNTVGNSSKSLVTTLHNTTKVFEYDDVLLHNATQMEVYGRTAGSAVRRDVMRGFNTTILVSCSCYMFPYVCSIAKELIEKNKYVLRQNPIRYSHYHSFVHSFMWLYVSIMVNK